MYEINPVTYRQPHGACKGDRQTGPATIESRFVPPSFKIMFLV